MMSFLGSLRIQFFFYYFNYCHHAFISTLWTLNSTRKIDERCMFPAMLFMTVNTVFNIRHIYMLKEPHELA